MAEHPARKFKAAKPVTQKTGPTFDHNDPSKFVNHGKFSGKTPANGIEDQMKGPTFTANETHIPTMNADKPAPMSKQKSDKKAPQYDPHSVKPSGSDKPVRTDSVYGLKKEYRK
jgi:hypothetical protein